MNANALICDEEQNFTLSEVILPDPGPCNLVIRTLYSGVSIGTELALIRNKLSWGPYPICTGYMAAGVVEHAGEKAGNFKVGEKVYYRDNRDIKLPSGRAVSAAAGTHCSRAVIEPNNTHGLDHLPDDVPADLASFFVMPAVGLYGVDMANPRLGDVVVVHGAGLIGLGVVAWCRMRGCVVVATDLDPRRLDVARKLGADFLIDVGRQDVAAEIEKIAPGGADVVFESTGVPECIDQAIAFCKEYGKFVWQGNYGSEPISMHFLAPHGRRLQMFFPCDDGFEPARRATLKNIAGGALPWNETVTHRIDPEGAPGMFDRINKGQAADALGVTIHWSD